MKNKLIRFYLLCITICISNVSIANVVISVDKNGSGPSNFSSIQSAFDWIETQASHFLISSPGTASLISGKISVSGSGTEFTSSTQTGDVIKFANSGWRYPIQNVYSNTSLEILTGSFDSDYSNASYQLSRPIDYVVEIAPGLYPQTSPLIPPDGYNIKILGLGISQEEVQIIGAAGLNQIAVPNLMLVGYQGKIILDNITLRFLSARDSLIPYCCGILIHNNGLADVDSLLIFEVKDSTIWSNVLGDIIDMTAASVQLINSDFFNTTDGLVLFTDNLLISQSYFEFSGSTTGQPIEVLVRSPSSVYRPWIIFNTTVSNGNTKVSGDATRAFYLRSYDDFIPEQPKNIYITNTSVDIAASSATKITSFEVESLTNGDPGNIILNLNSVTSNLSGVIYPENAIDLKAINATVNISSSNIPIIVNAGNSSIINE